MLKRDICQRSCRISATTNKKDNEIVPAKGAHIRKNKTPLKRSRRNCTVKNETKVEVGTVCCRKCRHEFDSHSLFQEHNCVEESELYQCHTCKLLFNHRKRFQEHMKQHRQNECKMCGQQFLRRKALLVHSRSMHGLEQLEKHYSCSLCDRKFIKKPSLIAHLKTHADSNKIVCVKCGFLSENEVEHSKHMEGHEAETKFECKKCAATFKRKQQYDQHMAGHDKHDCKICKINFSTKKLLIKHQKAIHDISVSCAKNHQCNVCGKKFHRPVTLKQHVLNTHSTEGNEKPVKCCEGCKKYFSSAAALAKHMKTTNHKKEDEQRSYLCAICGNRFSHSQGLNRHMEYAHCDKDNKNLQCNLCTYKTKCKANFKRHLDIHAEKRFVCEICGTSFHALPTLKQHHLYVHSERRDFVCTKCSKSFKGLSALQRHERIHSESRPFVCNCGQKYKRKSHLKRHVKTAHSTQTTENEDRPYETVIIPPQIAENDLTPLNHNPDPNHCEQQNYLPVEYQQQHQPIVDEIPYLNSDMMQIADDICQRALEQSILGLEHQSEPTQTDTSNSLICPMSVLDDMELQPNYCLQSDSLQMSEMFLKHAAASFRDEALSMDCSNINNFESYFREQSQYDPNNLNYQQYHF